MEVVARILAVMQTQADADMQDKDRLRREGGLDTTRSINTAEDWTYWDRGDTMKLVMGNVNSAGK